MDRMKSISTMFNPRRSSSVSKSSVVVDDQIFDEFESDGQPKSQTPRPQIFFSIGQDDEQSEMEKSYLAFLRSTYKFSPIHFCMAAMIGALLVFRFDLSSSPTWVETNVWYVAVIFNAIAIVIMILFIGSQMEKNLLPNKKDYHICSWILHKSPLHVEDQIIINIVLAASFNMLYITLGLINVQKLNSSGVNTTVVQDSVRAAETVPPEQVIVAYIGSFILPIVFGAASTIAIGACWLISLVFTMTIEVIVFNHLFPYLAVCSHIFLCAALYEIEKNKVIIYNSYKVADKTAGESKVKEQKEKVMRKREEIDRKLNEALLHAMVPKKVAEKLKAGRKVMPEQFPEVTIFFSDVEGFTNICAQVRPIQVVNMLNELYTVMDYCTSLFPLYKVETIGDAYMLVGGLPEKDPKHAQAIANFALTVCTAVGEVKSPLDGTPLRIRMGIHSGPVMAGVVGNLMPRYCLFGDTVNTASRMESNGEAGRIHCSSATAEILARQKNQHEVESRGEIQIKGKGMMHTYWVTKAGSANRSAGERQLENAVMTVRELLDEAKAHRLTDGSEIGVDGAGNPMKLTRRSSIAQMAEGYDRMYRNLTRAGSSSDTRRKSSAGLLGNFQRKTSAVVINSVQRKGGGNPLDTSRSKESIRHGGTGGGHENAGGGGTGGSSGHNHTEKGGLSIPHDGHHGEQPDTSHGKGLQQSNRGTGGHEMSDQERTSAKHDHTHSNVRRSMEATVGGIMGLMGIKAGGSFSMNNLSPNASGGASKKGALSRESSMHPNNDELNNSKSGRIAHGKSKANVLGVTNEHEKESSEETHMGTFAEMHKNAPSGRRILDPLPNTSNREVADDVGKFVPFSEASTGIESEMTPAAVVPAKPDVKPRILVVMSSAMQRKVLVRLLVNLDESWQINEAYDAEQALVKLKAVRGNYNVIIVDESLGSDNLRGHEFIQFIRSVMNVTAFIIGVASEGSENKKLLLHAGANIAWGRPPPPADQIKDLIIKVMAEVNYKKNRDK